MTKAVYFAITLFFTLGGETLHAMTFEERCPGGNVIESCYIIAEGEITAETPALFELEMGSASSSQILFNSPGGNLGAGIRLGRLIRENGFSTFIGTRTSLEANEYPPAGGQCLSACAYAFAGGVMRDLGPTGKLGFHQFRLGAHADISPEQLTEAVESAQAVSAQLISYLVEMGVDARVFTLASGKTGAGMHLISQEEAVEYDLVTPSGFRTFFLEPYGNGVVAASRRVDRTGPDNVVTQMTAYCIKDEPKLLFYAPKSQNLSDYGPGAFVLDVGNRRDIVPESGVSLRITDAGAYLEVSLPASYARAIEGAKSFSTWFKYPRVVGGHGADFTLTDTDKQMLKAAFRLCI